MCVCGDDMIIMYVWCGMVVVINMLCVIGVLCVLGMNDGVVACVVVYGCDVGGVVCCTFMVCGV